MKIKIITASHRANSNSKAMGHYLAKKLEEKNIDSSVLCLHDANIPLWAEDKFNPEKKDKWEGWNAISQELKSCDGFIFVVPEYNGMVPAILSNFFLLTDGEELAHKAGLIVGVSASINGVYPVAELRSFSHKNTKICYIPDHLIIRNVAEFLAEGSEYVEERIDYVLPVFAEYTKALNAVRKTGLTQTDKFKFGM